MKTQWKCSMSGLRPLKSNIIGKTSIGPCFVCFTCTVASNLGQTFLDVMRGPGWDFYNTVNLLILMIISQGNHHWIRWMLQGPDFAHFSFPQTNFPYRLIVHRSVLIMKTCMSMVFIFTRPWFKLITQGHHESVQD